MRAAYSGESAIKFSTLLLLTLSVWFLFLFTQKGSLDEAEHIHVAWMMGKLGLRPMVDFFQHHTPLLWDILKLYYLWGGEGARGLLFGRALVLLWALITCVSLYGFARLQSKQRPHSLFGFGLAVLTLVTVSITFGCLWTNRPETLSSALFALSVLSWSYRPRGRAWALAFDVAAGVALAVAIYASPRFLLLGGFFLLLPSRPKALFELSYERLLAMGVGCAVSLALLPWALGHDVEYLKFAVLFSAHLQKVGDPEFVKHAIHVRTPWQFVAIAQIFYAFTSLLHFLPRFQRSRLKCGLVYAGVVFLLSLTSSWPHYYPQNFFPSFLVVLFLLADFGSKLEWKSLPLARWYLSLTTGLCAVSAIWILLVLVSAEETLVESIFYRSQLQLLLEDSDTVLLSYDNHPIGRRDTSFFGPGLVDSQDRLCLAVASWKGKPTLPKCDYFSDFVTKLPSMVDNTLERVVPKEKLVEMRPLFVRVYQPVVVQTLKGKFDVSQVFVPATVKSRAREKASRDQGPFSSN